MKALHMKQQMVMELSITVLLATAGCDFQMGNWSQARFERTITTQRPLAALSLIHISEPTRPY